MVKRSTLGRPTSISCPTAPVPKNDKLCHFLKFMPGATKPTSPLASSQYQLTRTEKADDNFHTKQKSKPPTYTGLETEEQFGTDRVVLNSSRTTTNSSTPVVIVIAAALLALIVYLIYASSGTPMTNMNSEMPPCCIRKCYSSSRAVRSCTGCP